MKLLLRENPELIACPGCKRTDRFVLMGQFHSMDTKLVARVEAVRLGCEACKGVWDVTRAGAAVEVRPARVEQPAQSAPADGKEPDPLDSDLPRLFKRSRMPRV